MKKIFIIILMIFIVGCGKEEETETIINTPTPTIPPTPAYVDDNPIKVAFYKNKKIVKEYHAKFKDRTDIAILNIVFSNEENLGNDSFKNIWKNNYNKYENIDDYKIGFEISFTANGNEYNNVILDPSTGSKLHPYLYTFLYDDIHNSGHYSHVTVDDVKDNTIYSSIKVYLHLQTNEITSPITLTVFTYKNDNDFIDGHYRGNSKYTIDIIND